MENDSSDNHLYNLSNLLREMCDFLSSIMDRLPPPIQEKANFLIKKTQADADFGHYLNMQKITIKDTNSTLNEYVLAESKSIEYHHENEDESYENPDTINSHIVIEPIEPIEKSERICKYENLPAQQLCTMAVKIGLLHRKEKVFRYVEFFRKYFVGLFDVWLLFYGTEKDEKPNRYLNMLDYRATPVIGAKDDNKKLSCFELISTVEGSKSYQLMALTSKDMQQWVACINRAKQALQAAPTCTVSTKNLRRLPQPPDDIDHLDNEGLYMDLETEPAKSRLSNESDMYDEVGISTYYASTTEEPDEEEHYDDIGQFQIMPKSTSFLHRRRFNI